MIGGAPPDGMFDDEAPDPGEGQMPPCDLDAEALVVAHVLVAGSIDTVREHLRPSDFWSEANRLIYQACVDLAMQDAAIEPVAVKRALSDKGQLDRVGGIRYILDIVQKTPATAYVVDHAKSIATKARVRRMIEAADRIRILGYSANGSSTEYLAAALASVQLVVDDAPAASDEWIVGPDVFSQLDPIDWLCRDLYLCAGRPASFVGFSYSGKTVAAQSMALAIATGRKVWGEFSCRQSVVAHIDHEVGRRGTLRRYQRLAYGLGLAPDEVADRLRVLCLPKMRLSDDGAEQWYLRACDGVALCLVDSLRAATPGFDENDSRMREFVDRLLRVSDRTGTTFIVIHHAGKTVQGRSSRESGRGSSAIFDASGTVLQLAPDKSDDPDVVIAKVEMTKAGAEASGAVLKPFWLRIADVASEDGADLRAGLKCTHISDYASEDDGGSDRAVSLIKDKILNVLRKRGPLSASDIDTLTGGRRDGAHGRARTLLKIEGKIQAERRAGRGGGEVWSLVD